MNANMVCVTSGVPIISSKLPQKEREVPYERYATERKGFWLNTSLSMNRFSRSQDIGTLELAGREGVRSEAQCL